MSIVKLNKNLRRAVIMLRNEGNSKFHFRTQDFRQMLIDKNDSIKAVILGEKATHGFLENTEWVQKLVSAQIGKPAWPKNVEFKDGILFINESVDVEGESKGRCNRCLW